MPEHRNHLGQPVGWPVVGWSPRLRPPRTSMAGRFCTVEPLDPERHAAQLFTAYAEDREGRMWTYLPRGPYASPDEYRSFAETACQSDDPLVHTILDNNSGEAVGTASYMRIEPSVGVIEIGSITYSPRLQRRPAATEAMYLMMRRVFDELGYRRYEWKCDSLNQPSRDAAARLEGRTTPMALLETARRNDRGRAPSLALLAAVTALAFCALHIVVPALPLLAGVFDGTPARTQLVLTLYLAGIAGGQLVYGPISDRFGRRPVLIAGLAIFLVGTLICGLAWSLSALVLGRVLEGCGACAGIVLGRAIIRDVYDREAAARGLAIVMMAMSLAPGISPAIGAYLAEWVDWRAIFGVLGILGAIVLALTVARLGETNTQPARLHLVGMASACIVLLRSPQFLGFALCSACTTASWFTFIASAPHVLAEALDEPPSTYG